MLPEVLFAAIEHLERLQDYYRDEYEYHLSSALSAKAQREKIESLLEDLDNRNSNLPPRHPSRSEEIRNTRARVSDNEPYEVLTRAQLEPFSSDRLSYEAKLSRLVLRDSEVSAELRNAAISQAESSSTNLRSDTTLNSELDAVSNFLELSKTVLPAIKEIFESEPEKTLHLSYLQKLLNTKLNLELSEAKLRLYLRQAVERGYCYQDAHDSQCYVAKSVAIAPAKIHLDPQIPIASNGNGVVALELTKPKDKSLHKNDSRKKLHNLPPSNKLKPRLLETIEDFLTECHPKVFSTKDIIDYLYPKQQQSNWSSNRATKVRQALSNVLGRDNYLGTKWERIKLGRYRPLK